MRRDCCGRDTDGENIIGTLIIIVNNDEVSKVQRQEGFLRIPLLIEQKDSFRRGKQDKQKTRYGPCDTLETVRLG